MKRRSFLSTVIGGVAAALCPWKVGAEEPTETPQPLRDSIKKLGDTVMLNGHPYRVTRLAWHLTESIPENDVAIAIHYELKGQGKVSISNGTQRDS